MSLYELELRIWHAHVKAAHDAQTHAWPFPDFWTWILGWGSPANE
jgi:hypothetical protein